MVPFSRVALAIAFATVLSKSSYGAGCQAVIHQLTYNDVGTAMIGALPLGITIVPSQASARELALAYKAALEHGAAPRGTGKRSIVAGGPELDSPDQVEVRECKVESGRITLRLVHTSNSLSGGSLRRNVPYRPLVEVPLTTESGRFQVEVHWQAVESLSNGKPLAAPITLGPVSLTL